MLKHMGHKYLALGIGEDPADCGTQYTPDALDTICDTKLNSDSIYRVNADIAATTVREYHMLREKGTGTYILLQETYYGLTCKAMHSYCRGSNYDCHLTAFDRAVEAGVEDTDAGVLFGLYDPKLEVLSLVVHNTHLEERSRVDFHTILIPHLK